jgi:hypothetical protein
MLERMKSYRQSGDIVTSKEEKAKISASPTPYLTLPCCHIYQLGEPFGPFPDPAIAVTVLHGGNDLTLETRTVGSLSCAELWWKGDRSYERLHG